MTYTLHLFQDGGIADCRASLRRGFRRVGIVTPTGGGKTIMFTDLAKKAQAKGKKVAILTNRKMLLSQASDTFLEHGVHHGVVAAGHDALKFADIQICSIDTLASRVLRSEKMDLPDADLVIVDEIHRFANNTGITIIDEFVSNGAVVVGFTATPVGIKPVCEDLIVAGTYSELIDIGLLVPCDVFAPSEPDMKGVSMTNGEYSLNQMKQRVVDCQIFGDVYQNWLSTNPSRKPTILFAPGVEESIDFAEKLALKGVTTAHIDGTTPEAEREAIRDASKAGQIEIVCNCEVLTEGVNWPWIEHGILLHVCGGVRKYLQICGRLLRAHPGKTSCTMQDHSGAWHRHGPPDMNREWSLEDDDKDATKKRQKKMEKGEIEQQICCPSCGYVRNGGGQCPRCGHKHKKSVRRVRQVDGQLVKMYGPAVSIKKPKTDKQLFGQYMFRGGMGNMTISQVIGLFYKETLRWPSDDVIGIPQTDRGRKVTAVCPWVAKTVLKKRKKRI